MDAEGEVKELDEQLLVPFLAPASDYQDTRFFNCSVINCNSYLLPNSYLDLRVAGVSSRLRGEHPSVSLPEHTPTEPKGAGTVTGQHPSEARIQTYW